jgi:Lrp/AsnC family transcriptional regulator for asnA, asnC and gidA
VIIPAGNYVYRKKQLKFLGLISELFTFTKNYVNMGKVKLDEIDHQILDMLIDNTRTPFTDIAKKLLISAGTVHVRVKKMEEAGIIKGSSLTLDYVKLGYSFIAYVGIFLEKTHQTKFVLERLTLIPNVTVAHITTGKFNIFCKIRAKDTTHAKNIIFKIDDIDGISRTETMISLEESINDKKRLMHMIFNEL